jgi:hypothetical protein
MNETRLDAALKRIDVYGRVAFGGQCIGAMAMLAGPAMFIAACVIPFVVWGDDHAAAIVYWLAGWALGIFVAAGGLGFALFAWRWSGDWITEWPGYAVGFGIAGVADLLAVAGVVLTQVPAYAVVLVAMAAAFGAGCLVAGNLAGMRLLPEQRQQRQRAAERRR